MAMKEIIAFKCTYCGQVVDRPEKHEFECRYEPKSRTCATCGFSYELRSGEKENIRSVKYCPRADKVFTYPGDKYCSEYKRDPNFVEEI